MQAEGLPKGTLLLSHLGPANVREKPRMGRAALGKVRTGLIQAQLSIHREANFRGVLVFLAVVFPPAHRAQRQRTGRLQRLVSAAWTTKLILHGFLA